MPRRVAETFDLDNLVIHLAQPAFGIDETGTDDKGLPPGALVFEGEFDVETTLGIKHQTVRGPTTETHFHATNVEIQGPLPAARGR